MSLRQLEYLIAVIEEDHFGRAAEKCHVKQPSLSNGIKQLESELGITLFKRGRGQRLYGITEEGKKVSKWARLILANFNAMRDEIGEMKDNLQGRLRIGAMPSMSPVLPIILQRIRSAYPGLSVGVHFVGNEELKVSLDKYALDCAITYDDYEAEMSWCNAQPIFKETWSLLVPDSFEFESMEDISWNDAAKLPFAMLSPSMHERQLADTIFRGLGFEVTPKIESESILHLMFQTQYTELCTIIPTHFTRMPGMLNGTKALLLKEPLIEKGVSLFWVKTDNVMPMPSIAEKIAKSLAETGEMQNYLY